jgi:hypothetical protein
VVAVSAMGARVRRGGGSRASGGVWEVGGTRGVVRRGGPGRQGRRRRGVTRCLNGSTHIVSLAG